MANVLTHSLELGHGLSMTCSYPAVGSVDAKISIGHHKVLEHVFTVDAPGAHIGIKLPIIEADCKLTFNAFNGQLVWEGDLKVRLEPTHPWNTLLSGLDTLLQLDPSLGEIDGSAAANAPVLTGPAYGPGQLCTPVVLRFHVADGVRAVSQVGKIVKDVMFPTYPPFIFNTVACVGAVPPGAPGLYTDPESIWFNIFFGYYQLDCRKADRWTRPFGYDAANGVASNPVPEDVARLGKSDWNWFSNWMYGVPAAESTLYSTIDMTKVGVIGPKLVTIGAKRFHELRLNTVEVASTYQSDAPGAAKLTTNTIMAPIWMNAFGLPHPRPAFTTSFIPTTLDAVVDMAYFEDADGYHTVMFGGTSGQGAAPAFMDAQLAATRQVIVNSYPNLGFV